jgi:hypothetical protein
MTDEADEPLEGMETVALRVEFDLVPEWSNLVERIARHYGARVAMGVDGPSFVVKVAMLPERKPQFLVDVERHWAMFVERRKREGRWRR